MKGLPKNSPSRMAYEAVRNDKVAPSVFNSWPDQHHQFKNIEWHTIWEIHFGLPVSCLQEFVGNRIGATGHENDSTLDRHGHNLLRAGGRGFRHLEIGDWKRTHDKFVKSLNNIIRSGKCCFSKLEPKGLFDGCIPNGETKKDRPDILLRGGCFPETGVLVDCKTLMPSENRTTFGGPLSNGHKVQARQQKVDAYYVSRAHRHDLNSGLADLDSEIPDPGLEHPNGCLRRLRSFGRVLGPTMSSYCSVSSDCEDILKSIAKEKSEQVYRDMNFDEPHMAYSHILFWFRRVLSAIMHKAFAQLLIARIRWARRGIYRAQESLDQQASDHIFGEEGVNVAFSIHEHPPSMGDHLIGGEENRVDWGSTQSVGDSAPS